MRDFSGARPPDAEGAPAAGLPLVARARTFGRALSAKTRILASHAAGGIARATARAKRAWAGPSTPKRAVLVGAAALVIAIVVVASSDDTEERLAFMTEDHHRVRCFVVSELPRVGEPLAPKSIAQRLDLPLAHVNAILDDLEKNKTFLFRPDGENVAWAYPVTVAETPHQVAFSTGEEVNAA